MRVLVVDEGARVSVGASYFRAFSALGQDAHFLDSSVWLRGGPSLAARVASRLTRPVATVAYNAYVSAQLARLRPDILFVPKGGGLRARTIAAARRWARARVVFQNDDVKNRSNTTPDMLRAIPLWDAILTPRRFAIDELREAGARRVEYLPFAYDPVLHHPPAEGDRDVTLTQSAVFVGTWAPERVPALEALAARVPVVIFGNSWGRLPRRSPLRALVRPPVYEDGLRAIYAGAGVNVAFLRQANRDEHTMRTFEIPACGGFMLAERSPTHAELFGEGEQAAFFGSTEELVAQTEKYIADPASRRRIALAGLRRVEGRERYQDRAARVLEVVREVIAAPRA